MLKKFTFFLLLSVIAAPAWTQLNMSVMSQLQYNVELSDIWGYVAPDGSEYALVGANNGVSIVDVSDPADATEVAFIPGQSSRWRDIKTYGEFAYVVTDESGTSEGVTVIDLTNLPNSASATNWRPSLPGLGTLGRCHNIYIDEFGYAYLAGCTLNEGGMLIVDVFSTPGSPDFVSAAPSIYSHDVFVRDNKMYASELYVGRMAIYDVTDKEDIVILGVQSTPFEFTHNIWLSDDGNTAYTTDERSNAPVAAYDVTDPTDITELDQYRPTITLDEGVIPHNVHVWEDWLIISYYTDGGIVVDAARPDNLVEVGNFDTFFGTSGDGFDGVWGAYPFLPSGIVLLSDIGNGLYVMDVNYVRACYLEGKVTDAVTGAPINGTEIIIDAPNEPNINYSRLDGDYGTGIATTGTYQVSFFKPGYELFTTSVSIENGVVTMLDVELVPLARYSKEGAVVVEDIGSPVAGATIILDDGFTVFEFSGNDDGTFLIDDVYEGVFDVFVGSWGYRETLIEALEINNNQSITLEVAKGYEDSFTLDYGWTTQNNASTGAWIRAEPIGTYQNGSVINPEFDINNDFGDQCYVTGNGGGSWASDDIDGGAVILTSPVMALASTYVDPVVEYNLWFYNGGGSGNPNDDVEVEITNGTETVTIEVVDDSGSFWRNRSSIRLSDFITVTDEMQLIVTAGDYDPGHIAEAAFDAFSVSGDLLVNTSEAFVDATWKIAPNPSKDDFVVAYELTETPHHAQLRVVNTLGQVVANYTVTAAADRINLGHNWLPGVYFVYLEVDGQQTRMERLVKQ
jgi:choice-of-anchor B domain-containing protein